MTVDIHDTFRRGGRGLVDLLEFCVLSIKLDPVFVFLVGEFKLHPTAAKAIALYDVFCAPESQTRISVTEVLPPRNLQIRQVVEDLRKRYLAAQPTDKSSPGSDERSDLLPVPLPGRYIFDAIAEEVWQGRQLRSVAQAFDPTLSPQENLPNGRLTDGQRAFIDYVWEPRIRPYLVSAGFRRIANIA